MEKLKQDIVGNQKIHEEEVCKLQKVIQEMRIALKEKDKTISKNKEGQTLSINLSNSPN